MRISFRGNTSTIVTAKLLAEALTYGCSAP
jgi:hypothetical protein